MPRDPYKLEAFLAADALVVEVYKASRAFPSEERYGLQSQIRRAAVSVAANLVEGCARPSQREYLHFVSIAIASASELRYLLELSVRLELIAAETVADLSRGYGGVIRRLQALRTSLTASA